MSQDLTGGFPDRTLFALVLAGVVATVILTGVAMAAYPGGTYWQTNSVGHTFWQNFWCDLLRERAHNGQENPGAPLASASMVSLALSLAVFWPLLARALARQGALERLSASVMLALGGFAALALTLVSLSPSDASPTLHGISIVVGGLCGISALVFALSGLLRAGARLPVTVAFAALVVGCANLIQYAREYLLLAPSSPLLPTVQKATTLLALTWVVVSTLWAERGNRSASRAYG